MANYKPASMINHHNITKSEKERRMRMEKKLKGNCPFLLKVPLEIKKTRSKEYIKQYKETLKNVNPDILNEFDHQHMIILVDAILEIKRYNNMILKTEDVRELKDLTGLRNKAIEIQKTYSNILCLQPKGRATVGMEETIEQEEDDDFDL